MSTTSTSTKSVITSSLTTSQIVARLEELRAAHWVVETNEGTFSALEGHAAVGSGRPDLATWHVVYYADGRAPVRTNPRAASVGYARHFPQAKHDAKAARYEFVALERELERRGEVAR
jgi:hypothetical protein